MRSLVSIAVVVVVGVGFVALAYGVLGRNQIVVQPIAFNHAVHLDEADLQCADCHTDAETHVYAGLPGKDVCLDCHDIDEEGGSHPEKDKLFSFEEGDVEIPWVRVALSGPDVFFSHRRHVRAAGMDCLECHPGQPTLTEPPSVARLVMTMAVCIECHQESRVSNDCLACHR
jgi:hypothetical protein